MFMALPNVKTTGIHFPSSGLKIFDTLVSSLSSSVLSVWLNIDLVWFESDFFASSSDNPPTYCLSTLSLILSMKEPNDFYSLKSIFPLTKQMNHIFNSRIPLFQYWYEPILTLFLYFHVKKIFQHSTISYLLCTVCYKQRIIIGNKQAGMAGIISVTWSLVCTYNQFTDHTFIY